MVTRSESWHRPAVVIAGKPRFGYLSGPWLGRRRTYLIGDKPTVNVLRAGKPLRLVMTLMP
jgi:hypothetical protein